jgi:hypothetical protein
MDFLKHIIALAAITCAFPTLAQGENTGNVDKATLTVSPTACALEEEKRLCEMDVAVVWEVPKAGDYCLYYHNKETPLQCWSEQIAGAMRYTFSDGKDGEFYLISHANIIEARAKVRVIGAIEQQLRARRRSGFWRIF